MRALPANLTWHFSGPIRRGPAFIIQIMFIIAGAIYLLAVLVFHLIAPRLEPVELSKDCQMPQSAN